MYQVQYNLYVTQNWIPYHTQRMPDRDIAFLRAVVYIEGWLAPICEFLLNEPNTFLN